MTTFKTKIHTTWEGALTGSGLLRGEHLNTTLAIPKYIGGSGEGVDPKELLIASASTCYVASIVLLLERRNLPIVELTIQTEATKSRERWHIIHYPQIVLSKESTEQHIQSAKKVLIGADRGCEIGNLLKKSGMTIEVKGEVSLQ